MTVYIDPEMTDEEMRGELFAGNLIVLTRLAAVQELATLMRSELEELFAPHDPEFVHDYYTPAELAGLLSTWKPRFIHDERSQKLVRAITEQAGFPAAQTHFDLPKPRTAFPEGHLNTGIAFAFPWHRDVWYSAPAQQINWWLPVFAARPDNSMSFDLASFARPVANDSDRFDYYRNNAARRTTAAQVTREVQVRPGALDHHPEQELVVLPAPGAVLLFSGAQLHTSIPNSSGRSRYSIDFRTVDARDVLAGRGAPMVDVRCTGTAIRDFRNVADGSCFDEETITDLFGPTPAGATLVFDPGDAGALSPAERVTNDGG